MSYLVVFGVVDGVAAAGTGFTSCSTTSDESESEDEDFFGFFALAFLGGSTFFSLLTFGDAFASILDVTFSSTTSSESFEDEDSYVFVAAGFTASALIFVIS